MRLCIFFFSILHHRAVLHSSYFAILGVRNADDFRNAFYAARSRGQQPQYYQAVPVAQPAPMGASSTIVSASERTLLNLNHRGRHYGAAEGANGDAQCRWANGGGVPAGKEEVTLVIIFASVDHEMYDVYYISSVHQPYVRLIDQQNRCQGRLRLAPSRRISEHRLSQHELRLDLRAGIVAVLLRRTSL